MARLRAIDLYSGVGGWALGFKVAGIELVQSYEWWEPAAKTESRNLGIPVCVTDIRTLDIQELPTNIDVVVGSPPCTQFSYSNRGGSGDIADGLKDISKFLEVVDYLKPKYWAMENVPRVKKVLESELHEDGQLSQFMHLREEMQIEVIDASEFGLPQRRKRCIAGNFPIDLLREYKQKCHTTTLGEAIEGFSSSKIWDINYGFSVATKQLFDHVPEPAFDDEELRINRDSKEHHPVYNGMQFPDPWDRPVRTVTATCSRVSRESVVIRDTVEAEVFRRLSIRERATVQGFPITFQFYGNSYAEKTKMVGNAIPPVLTYYIGMAIRGVSVKKLNPLATANYIHQLPETLPKQTRPDHAGKSYPKNRTFRFAVPNLRFKSGTRFDLTNTCKDEKTVWRMEFYYGPSKDIRRITLNADLFDKLRGLNWLSDFETAIQAPLDTLERTVSTWDGNALQKRWTDKSSTSPHPIVLLDHLGDAAADMIDRIPSTYADELADIVIQIASSETSKEALVSERKIRRYSTEIFCGLALGSFFNSRLSLAA